mgnify:CR=1 FL=1
MKPCIAIDISKGKSYYQGFISLNEPYTKAKPIHHDKVGYDELMSVGMTMKEKYGDIDYVFESTGIYHKGLQNRLEMEEQKYIILNPLEAAKIRKSKLRSTKTDKKDCQSIALAYYTREHEPHNKKDKLHETLQIMNWEYKLSIQILRQMKVRFRNLLDIVYPKWDEIYNNPYTEVPMALLKKYPHPEEIKNKHEETIAKYLEKSTTHHHAFSLNEARKVKLYADKTASGCHRDGYEVQVLSSLAKRLETHQQAVNQCLDRMKGLVNDNRFYDQLQSIPGIGSILAIRLFAELGDLGRFSHSRKLVAYAGIDPIVYQSGQRTGEHLSITKKGNKNLRCLLYLAINANIRSKKPNSIIDFYNKKRQQANPLAYRAAVIACANKLLRIIYSMHRSGNYFKY